MARRRSTRRADPRFTPADVRIGYVSGVFGLRGDVRLFLYNPSSDFVGKTVRWVFVDADGQRVEREVRTRAGSGKRVLARVEGITSPEAAQALHEHELVVPVDSLPELAFGEWYERDLLGTPVETDSGEVLGTIKEVSHGPGMDTWVIRGASGEVWFHVELDQLVECQPPDRIVVRADAVLRL